MNQDERKKFWDVLSTMHDMTPAHIQQLQQTIVSIVSSLHSGIMDHLHPLVIPSHTPIGLFNNQQRIKERNLHLPENIFQTGSAGG